MACFANLLALSWSSSAAFDPFIIIACRAGRRDVRFALIARFHLTTLCTCDRCVVKTRMSSQAPATVAPSRWRWHGGGCGTPLRRFPPKRDCQTLDAERARHCFVPLFPLSDHVVLVLFVFVHLPAAVNSREVFERVALKLRPRPSVTPQIFSSSCQAPSKRT